MNKIKKFLLIGLININRISQILCQILFLKLILLYHVNFKEPEFLLLLGIKNIEDGRKYFLVYLLIFLALSYIAQQLTYLLTTKDTTISKGICYIIFLNEIFLISIIFIIFYSSYIIYLILTIIVIIFFNIKTSNSNDFFSFQFRIGLVLITILTFYNQLFFNNIIIFFIFVLLVRFYIKNIWKFYNLRNNKKEFKIKNIFNI